MDEKNFSEAAKNEWKTHRRKMIVYLVLRILVVATLIAQIFNKDWNNVFLCVLTLILFMVPSVLERTLKIDLPNGLEIIIVLFIFAAEILGEINEYYILFERWDVMLHTLNGFLMAAIGLSLIDILNRSDKVHLELDNKFVVMCGFCFSMTIGVLWEFFEYAMDRFFGMDMQKDVFLDHVTSALLNPTGGIEAHTVNIESVVVNGQQWLGYIDIGLTDTMHDMFVNFIGAVVFSIFGAIYLQGRGRGKFVEGLIPVMKETDASKAIKEFDENKVGQAKEDAEDEGDLKNI